MKVKVKKWHGVASWSWNNCVEDVCGVCRDPFDVCCPAEKCRFPGDDCPPVTGVCGHVFHMHCIFTWVEKHEESRGTCPMCRGPWEISKN